MEYTSQKTFFKTYTNGKTPYIGENGNWWIGKEDTGVSAEGKNAVILVLSNDNDIISKTLNGRLIGTLPQVAAQVYRGGDLDETSVPSLKTVPANFVEQRHYTYLNGQLSIISVPEDFSNGYFVFKFGDIEKKFGLKVITSNVDYSLKIDQTTINNSSEEGTIQVKVEKIDAAGNRTELGADNEEVDIYINGSNNPEDNWNIPYTTTTETLLIELKEKIVDECQVPVKVTYFVWDQETIEFVKNGQPGNSFYTWIMYADNADGNNMTEDPSGMSFIGIATNKTESEPSTDPKDYKWSLIQGEPGEDGTPIEISDVYYCAWSSANEPPKDDNDAWKGSIDQVQVSGTNPYLWTRVDYSDGSSTYTVSKNEISREDLWGSLEEEDGLYYDENTKLLAIRASAINTGALQIGGKTGEPDSDGVVFYADFTSGVATNPVRLAGWKIASGSIVTGTLGNQNSFHMYSTPKTDSNGLFGSNGEKKWMLGIGEYFGVTDNGEIYARKGLIGQFIINEQLLYENLEKGSDEISIPLIEARLAQKFVNGKAPTIRISTVTQHKEKEWVSDDCGNGQYVTYEWTEVQTKEEIAKQGVEIGSQNIFLYEEQEYFKYWVETGTKEDPYLKSWKQVYGKYRKGLQFSIDGTINFIHSDFNVAPDNHYSQTNIEGVSLTSGRYDSLQRYRYMGTDGGIYVPQIITTRHNYLLLNSFNGLSAKLKTDQLVLSNGIISMDFAGYKQLDLRKLNIEKLIEDYKCNPNLILYGEFYPSWASEDIRKKNFGAPYCSYFNISDGVIELENNTSNQYAGIAIYGTNSHNEVRFEQDVNYVLSFKIQDLYEEPPAHATVTTRYDYITHIAGHTGGATDKETGNFDEGNFTTRRIEINGGTYLGMPFQKGVQLNQPGTQRIYHVKIYLTCKKTGADLYIQPCRVGGNKNYYVKITEFKLEKGSNYTGYTPPQ